MVQIVEYYTELNRKIREATTKKQLQLYRRRGRIFMNNLPTENEKMIAKKHYKRSLMLIKSRG